MIPISYNVRSLFVRKATTIATVLGVALVVFVFAAVMMLNTGINNALGKSGRADNAIVLRQGSDAELSSGMDAAQVNAMRGKEMLARTGVNVVGEVVVVVTLDKVAGDGIANVQIRGVPTDVYEFRPEVKIVEGRKAQPGTDEVVIGKNLRGMFKGVQIGQSFELKKNRAVKVVGVFAADGSTFESEVWVDVDTLRADFGRPAMVSSMRVRLASPAKFDAFKTEVEADKNLGLQVLRETTYYENQSSGMTTLITILGIIIASFFGIGAIIGAAITMYAAVANRQREIGTLRALGFSKLSILGSFLLESMLLALAAGAIGAALSLIMGTQSFSMLNQTTWSQVIVNFQTSPFVILLSLAVGGGVGLVGGFFPAYRACRVSPINAMRA